MKMSKDDIFDVLNKAVSKAIGDDNTNTDSDSKNHDDIANLRKEITAVSSQVKQIAELAANGFEKPKTPEDLIKEAIKPVMDKISELNKKVNGEDEEDEKLPENKKELNKMIEGALNKALEKVVTKKGKPTGESKDDDSDTDDSDNLSKSVIDMTESELEEALMNKSINGIDITDQLASEKEDAAGNALSKVQLLKRAKLDSYIGKFLKESSGNMNKEITGKDNDDSEEFELEFDEE